MSRRSYTVPIVLLLSILAGKLLLTQVQNPPAGSSWMSHDRARGWPWPYSRSIETNFPDSGVSGGWQSLGFSYLVLLADLVLLLVMVTVATLLLCRLCRRLGRLLQFSLGEMLVLVTVAAVVCGWTSLRYRQWHREQQTFASFPDGMFDTHEEYRGPEWLRRVVPEDRLTIFHRAVEVSAEDLRPGDTTASSLVVALVDAPYVHKLNLHATLASRLTDPAPLANIDELYLFSNGNTADVDDALTQIARWQQLRKLTIKVDEQSSFSDRGLAALGESVTLGDLTIAEGKLPLVTDAGIAALVKAPRLRSLALPQTKLTDAAMRSLAEMPALMYLSVADFPDVTSEGIRKLADSKSLVSIAFPDHPRFSDESLKLLASRVKDVTIILPGGTSRRIQSP